MKTKENTATSILTDVKKMLGIVQTNTDFDAQIIIMINTVLGGLFQQGIGPEDGLTITGTTETWDDFSDDYLTLQLVKTYISAKVRLMFDPPENSTLNQSLTAIANEYEYRLYITQNYLDEEEEEENKNGKRV